GALLKPRLDHRIVGTIGEPGLSGPNDYAFYLGSDRLVHGSDVTRIDHFGDESAPGEFDPVLLTLTVIIFVVLLLPVAVFTAAPAPGGAACGGVRSCHCWASRCSGRSWAAPGSGTVR